MIDPPDVETPSQRAADWFAAVWLGSWGLAVALGEPVFRLSPENNLRLIEFALAVSTIVLGFLAFRVRRLGRRLLAVEELMADVRFGPGTKRDREAVDILVQALRVSDPGARETALRTLRKISGLDLGSEAAPWEHWWSLARSTFVRPGPPPGREPAPKK